VSYRCEHSPPRTQEQPRRAPLIRRPLCREMSGNSKLYIQSSTMKTERLAIALLATALVFTVAQNQTQAAAPRKFIKIPRPNTMLQSVPFSDAVLDGHTLYLAGRIGIDPKTGTPPETAEAEAKLALDGIQNVLKQAGMTMDDLVYVQVFCSDLQNYDKFNSVYRSYFKGDFPARAFVGSGKLLFNGRFEVQAIAKKK
jgi:2-iminobutanoate/2-iminopropanoate deaminase